MYSQYLYLLVLCNCHNIYYKRNKKFVSAKQMECTCTSLFLYIHWTLYTIIISTKPNYHSVFHLETTFLMHHSVIGKFCKHNTWHGNFIIYKHSSHQHEFQNPLQHDTISLVILCNHCYHISKLPGIELLLLVIGFREEGNLLVIFRRC